MITWIHVPISLPLRRRPALHMLRQLFLTSGVAMIGLQDARATGFAATQRRDAWWVAPLLQGLVLAVLITYANWAAFQGKNYQAGGYLSPLYSPLITVSWFPFSPA